MTLKSYISIHVSNWWVDVVLTVRAVYFYWKICSPWKKRSPWKGFLYRSILHNAIISFLKVETQTDQLEHLREKLRMAQDETRSMQAKHEVLERFVETRP